MFSLLVYTHKHWISSSRSTFHARNSCLETSSRNFRPCLIQNWQVCARSLGVLGHGGPAHTYSPKREAAAAGILNCTRDESPLFPPAGSWVCFQRAKATHAVTSRPWLRKNLLKHTTRVVYFVLERGLAEDHCWQINDSLSSRGVTHARLIYSHGCDRRVCASSGVWPVVFSGTTKYFVGNFAILLLIRLWGLWKDHAIQHPCPPLLKGWGYSLPS